MSAVQNISWSAIMSANFADLVSHCSQFADILSWLHFSLEINVMWGQSAKHEMIVARTHKKNDKRLPDLDLVDILLRKKYVQRKSY